MALITLQQAKQHLRVDDDDHNVDIDLKLTQASDIVTHYLKDQADDTWTPTTTPGNVQAATLIVIEALFAHAAIDWDVIGRLLVGYRDPTLA